MRANEYFLLLHELIHLSNPENPGPRIWKVATDTGSLCCAEPAFTVGTTVCRLPDLPAHDAPARVEEVRIFLIGVDAILAFVRAAKNGMDSSVAIINGIIWEAELLMMVPVW